MDKSSSDGYCTEEQGLWLVAQSALGRPYWPPATSKNLLRAGPSHQEFSGLLFDLPSGPVRGEVLAGGTLLAIG